MKTIIVTILFVTGGFLSVHAQEDTYVPTNGNLVTHPGAELSIFGNLINDARGTKTSASTTSTGVNHKDGGTVYLYRHSTNGSGNSRIYDGPSATPNTDNYNAGGSAVRFYDLILDNNVGTNTASGTVINGSGGSGEIQIEQEVCVSNQLTFTNGKVWTPRDKWKHAYLHFDADAATYTGALTSNATATGAALKMVDGYVAKTGASNFVFPIGDGVYTRFSGLSSPSTGTYKSAYFKKNSQSGTAGISGPNGAATPMNNGITIVNTSEFWDIDGTAASNFTLYANNANSYSNWTSDFAHGTNVSTDIVIAAFDAWESLGIGSAPSSFSADGAYTTTTPSNPDAGGASGVGFSAFSWGFINSNPLDLKLVSFDAALKNCQSLLTWSTSQEKNTSHVVIERKDDINADFYTLANVPLSGNSTTVKNYNYTDTKEYNGEKTIYYRLKLVDMDGKFMYSSTKTVTPNCNTSSLSIYPNPTSGDITVSGTGFESNDKIQVNIVNVLGQAVYNSTLQLGNNTNSFDTKIQLGHLANGLYEIRILSEISHSVNTTKFNIQK